MIDAVAALAFAMCIATIVVLLVQAYDEPPDWWKPG